MLLRFLFSILFCLSCYTSYCQQDVDLHLNATLLPGKNILKIKRDFHDPYLWVLAQNNEVYRINSITNVIDNYTRQFTAYSNLKFVDIAGRSQDTVFIATNSTNLIELKKGVIKVIGTADGIPGVLNSIGFIYNGDYMTDNTAVLHTPHIPTTILIGTNDGMCHYDYKNEVMVPGSSKVLAKVFETTYRTNLFSVFEEPEYPDPVPLHAIFTVQFGGEFGGNIWYGSNGFGNILNTAYCVDNVVVDDYQNFLTQAYSPSYLMNFFWGTETGLFQNQRGASNYSAEPQRKYLNGINVNKITSIFGLRAFGTSAYSGLIKENILVGTDQGLYFSNSGYFQKGSAYLPQYTFFHDADLGTKKINDICVNATSYTIPICEDGIWVAAIDGLYLLKPDYGAYINPTQKISAVAFDGANFNASTIQLCAGTTAKVNISTYSIYGNNAVQWYKDTQALPNQSGTSLTITTSGDYNAVIYDPCSPLHFETNHLQVTQIAAPILNFNYPDTLNYCDGNSATVQTDNNSLYQYRWYKNGVLNGITTNSINITQTGNYRVEISACSGNWISSKIIQVNFIKLPVVTLKTNKNSYCIGDKATLSTNALVDPYNTITWLRDGTILTASTNQTSIVTDTSGNYSVLITSNKTTCAQASNSVPLIFNPIPTISIQKIINTTLCSGQTVDLQAIISSGTIKWSTGETGSRISIKNSGNYKATITSASGCIDSSAVNVQFFSNPTLSLEDAALCQFTNETITLTAPTGFNKYTWNGQTGTNTFVVSKPGVVILTVTDQNGCTATQTINIESHCPNIYIPNTFTPNADGINDKWIISGFENDLSITVTIYNRLGNMVYKSDGYSSPWDGTFAGKKLPMGTYYYIINARAMKQVFSGSVNIIY